MDEERDREAEDRAATANARWLFIALVLAGIFYVAGGVNWLIELFANEFGRWFG